jgi:hypothetical protein
MRKNLITSLAIFLGALLVGAVLAYAAGETTGTNVSCATATLPAHTVGVDGVGVNTIAGTSTSNCHTETYTIPTSTVTATPTTSGSTTSSTSTSSLGACAASPPGSTWTVGGHDYTRAGWDTFTKDAAVGSFAQSGTGISSGDNLPAVYTGDHGMGWTEYPDGWGANGVTPAYQPSTVQSVHDGVLDFSLHNDLGASISPMPGGNRDQTYGAWSYCEKVDPALLTSPDFKQAPLLWPQSDANGPAAESDFPEGNYGAAPNAGQFSAFAHNSATTQDAFQISSVIPGFDITQWHVYTQTWQPGQRCYYADGTQIGCSTSAVFSSPERWQLQMQPLQGQTGHGGAGHVYVNWAWIGAPASTSSTSSSTSTTSTTPTTSTSSTTTTSTTSSAPPPTGVQHVVLVSMENQDYTNIYPTQTFEKTFADQGGLATHYYGTGHFSLDNYITATSGLTGVGNNDSCLSSSANNIFNQLGAGNAVNLEESGAACRHEPAGQYSDLGSGFQQSLPSTFDANTFNPKFVWITPTDGHNGHDNGPGGADSYLSGLIPKIEATPQYQNGSMAVIIWYDESNVNDVQGNTVPPDNHVYLAVQRKGVAASTDATTYTHCSLLATLEDVFGLGRLGCAVGAPSMVGHFGF